MNFGQKIKDLRIKRNLTLRELAEKVKLDFTYLSKIENGLMGPPREDKIRKLADVLMTNVDELILLAKKVPKELRDMVVDRKDLIPDLLRSASELSDTELKQLIQEIQERKEKKK